MRTAEEMKTATAKEIYQRHYLSTLGDKRSVQDRAILPAMEEYADLKVMEYRNQPQEEKKPEPHKCKYCGGWFTSESDEGCYANQNKGTSSTVDNTEK